MWQEARPATRAAQHSHVIGVADDYLPSLFRHINNAALRISPMNTFAFFLYALLR
jgi:hypothetical protein